MAKRQEIRELITTVNDRNCEKSSVVFNVRVRITDLASLCEFQIAMGIPPKSGGHAVSQALVMFTESLIAHHRAKKYELNDAKILCEGIGVATGSKTNVRIFGSQFEPTAPKHDLTPEEMKKLISTFEGLESARTVSNSELPSGFLADSVKPSGPEDLAVPKDDDSLISALEVGKPKLVED
jgi:hypothetical protein